MKALLAKLRRDVKALENQFQNKPELLNKVKDMDSLWALAEKQADFPYWGASAFLQKVRDEIKQYVQPKISVSQDSITRVEYLQYITNLLTIKVIDQDSLALARVVEELLLALQAEKSSASWSYWAPLLLTKELTEDVNAEMDAVLELLPALQKAITDYQQKVAEEQAVVAKETAKKIQQAAQVITEACLKIASLRAEQETKYQALQKRLGTCAQWEIRGLQLAANDERQEIEKNVSLAAQGCQAQFAAIKAGVQTAVTDDAFHPIKAQIKQLKAVLDTLKSKARDNAAIQAVAAEYNTEISPLVNKKQRGFFVTSLKAKVSAYLAARAITYRIRDIISSVMSFCFGWLGWTTEKSKRQTYVDTTLFTQLNAFNNLGDKGDVEKEKTAVSEVKQAINTGLTLFSPRAEAGPQHEKSLKYLLDTANKELDEMSKEQELTV